VKLTSKKRGKGAIKAALKGQLKKLSYKKRKDLAWFLIVYYI
jgi:hypothetical protein